MALISAIASSTVKSSNPQIFAFFITPESSKTKAHVMVTPRNVGSRAE